MEIAYKIAGSLVTPPGIIIVIAILGLLIHIKKPLLGAFLFSIATAALLALSLPLFAFQLVNPLQRFPAVKLDALDPHSPDYPQAIVVLGGGRDIDAPEYGGDTVNGASLIRARYAARLAHRTGLPVLATGGAPFGEAVPEAALLREALEEYGVKPRWLEDRSRNTGENAAFSAAILQHAGVKRVLLVTQAWHMRRALRDFEQQGLKVIPAPTDFIRLAPADYRLRGYLPSAHALEISSTALHEYIGYWRSTPTNASLAPATASP